MTTATKAKAVAKGSRNSELATMLEDRRRELGDEVQGRIRDARTAGTNERQVLDQGGSVLSLVEK